MAKGNQYFRPFLVNIGVVLALSFAGFFYSRFKIKKIKKYLPRPKFLYAPDSFVERENAKDILPTSEHIYVYTISTPVSRTYPTFEPIMCQEEMSMQRTSDDNASSDLSPRQKHVGDFLSQDFSDDNDPKLETEPPPPPGFEHDASRTLSTSAEKDEYEQEIKHLRSIVRTLSERERNLEIELLEYYGLKEQETMVFELRNQLKINKMESELFGHRIESLRAENARLEARVADHARVIAELEAARSKVKVFKKKLRHEAEQHRQQILNIQKRVARLQEQELTAPGNDDRDSESNTKRLKDLEVEAEELRKSNARLQMENSELSRKLQSIQIHPNSASDNVEIETLNETSNGLRQENEELTKQIEQLKAEKFTDVEELVYLRWINACLRYELKIYQPMSDKTSARDLSESLSPRSEEKAKKLILEYAKAEGSSIDKSMDFDCDQLLRSPSQTPIATDDSSGEHSSSKPTNKVKFFAKLRKLLHGKDTSKLGDNQQEDVDSPMSTKSCSSATSSDIPTSRSLNTEHVDRRRRRNSDFGSYGHKRFVSPGKDDDPESIVETRKSNRDHNSSLKSDLIKFAEVLKQQTLVEEKR